MTYPLYLNIKRVPLNVKRVIILIYILETKSCVSFNIVLIHICNKILQRAMLDVYKGIIYLVYNV